VKISVHDGDDRCLNNLIIYSVLYLKTYSILRKEGAIPRVKYQSTFWYSYSYFIHALHWIRSWRTLREDWRVMFSKLATVELPSSEIWWTKVDGLLTWGILSGDHVCIVLYFILPGPSFFLYVRAFVIECFLRWRLYYSVLI
jgi:hypothetical protein